MDDLRSAYRPDTFREQGHHLVDLLADHLESNLSGQQAQVIPWTEPADELAFWTHRMKQPPEPVTEFLRDILARSIRLHHPHYLGHQVGVVAPPAALAGLVSSLLNNGSAIYDMGAASTALEHWITRETAHTLGFPEGDGFLTSGGTLAMLTALLAARNLKLGPQGFAEGTRPDWSVLASEEAHYCVSRAVHIMGGGAAALVPVPVDHHFRMRVDELERIHHDACQRNRKPIAIVANAGSTSTGSYDNLERIADFARQHDLWFHVDGAHGGAAAFCPELRHKLNGAQLADSVMLDFHKMFMTPALATALVFRNRDHSWAGFHQEAQYLYTDDGTEDWFNLGKRTFECTKQMLSIKIAALWRSHGTTLFAQYLRRVHNLATQFASYLRERPCFEIATEPESNIVCYRYRPHGLSDRETDAVNSLVRKQIVQTGAFYLVQTRLNGRTWLRSALMNPFTTLDELRDLVDTVETRARFVGNVNAHQGS